jgi:hypothetical protein
MKKINDWYVDGLPKSDLTKRNLYHGLANYLLIDALFLRYRYIGYFYKGKTKGFFIYQKLF